MENNNKDGIAESIHKFAEDKNLLIHPGQKALKWPDLVIKNRGWPNAGRSECCPCKFALEDIKQLNRCRCGLFVNVAYIKEYNRLTAYKPQSQVITIGWLADDKEQRTVYPVTVAMRRRAKCL